MLVVERCYLNVRALIATPYASALAATSEEERRLGVTCIDIGGGTATVAAFATATSSMPRPIPVGGHHITLGYRPGLADATCRGQRIKTLYGTMVVAQSDEYEAFSYALAGEEEGARGQATKAQLAGIIRPRVAGILGMVRERLDKAGVSAFAGERVVLTGGASGSSGSANSPPTRLDDRRGYRCRSRLRGCRRVSAVRRFRPLRGCCRRCVGKRRGLGGAGPRGVRWGILRARR